MILKDVYDLPHEAIAEELGISVAAARFACTGPASACGTCSSRSREVLLVRCEDVALILPRAVDIGEPVDGPCSTT